DNGGNEITGSSTANQILSSYQGGTALGLASGGTGTGGGGGGSTVTGTGISSQDVLSAISRGDSNYISNLLRGTGLNVNDQLSCDPAVNQALFSYMTSHGMTSGFSSGTLGSLILGSNAKITSTTTNVQPGAGGQTWSDLEFTSAYNASLRPVTV